MHAKDSPATAGQTPLSAAALSAFCQASPDPQVVLDGTGAVRYLNPAARLWQDRLAEGQLWDMLPPNVRELTREALGSDQPRRDVEVTVRRRVLLWTFAPVASESLVFLTGRDVTESRQTEAKLRISEARYRLLLENSTDVICRHRPNGELIYASPAGEALLGFKFHEVIGRSAYELFHPDDARALLDREAGHVSEQGILTNTYRIQRKDGHYVWFESTSRILRDPITGERQEILSVSRDVTPRIQAERDNRRLARIVEATTDLVMSCRADGTLIYANAAARSRLGLPRDLDRESVNAVQLCCGEDWERLLHEGVPVALEKGLWCGEIQMRALEGDRRLPVSMVALAHRETEDEALLFSTIARDMSEIKQAQERTRQHQSELAHVTRLVTLGEMASGLAHELNQPLAAIANYARGSVRRLEADHRLERGLLRDALERIAVQAERAGGIIRGMRNFVRKTEPRRSACDVNTLVDNAARMLRPEATRVGVTLELRLGPGLPDLHADGIQIEQVILNLMRNAIEAATGASPSLVRVCTALESDTGIALEVEDSGAGLPGDAPEQVFEAFFTTKGNGLGMGLAISRSIIEAHGGRLRAGSGRLGGAMFRCELPLGPGDRSTVATAATPPTDNKTTDNHQEPHTLWTEARGPSS
jgi:two-component system sensor kinase FixL